MSPENRAIRSAEVMWARDDASKGIGMVLDRVMPGRAVCSMSVQKRHTNGHDICHGGYVFALADTAFAFACNSYNQPAVAQHNTITYLAPGQLGDRLTATAVETARSGRSGIYDVAVANQNGETIALLRGACRILRGQLFEEDQA